MVKIEENQRITVKFKGKGRKMVKFEKKTKKNGKI